MPENKLTCTKCGKEIKPGESYRTANDPTVLCKDCQPKPEAKMIPVAPVEQPK